MIRRLAMRMKQERKACTSKGVQAGSSSSSASHHAVNRCIIKLADNKAYPKNSQFTSKGRSEPESVFLGAKFSVGHAYEDASLDNLQGLRAKM